MTATLLPGESHLRSGLSRDDVSLAAPSRGSVNPCVLSFEDVPSGMIS